MATVLDNFRNASPRRQVAIAIAVAAGLALALISLYFAFLRRPYEVLYSDLEATDAASIVAELEKESVSYRLADGGRTILVLQERADATRLALAGGEFASRGVVGFEVFNRSDMGLTEFAQRINYQRALQGELTRTIMAIDGIQSARVHLSISEPSVFRADRIPPKASISLVAKARESITSELVAGVQRLVASAVPELAPESVVVVDETGAVVSAVVRSETSIEPPGVQQTHAIETYYTASIRRAITELSPSTDPTVSAVLDGLDQDQALKTWTPQTRTFALRVTLTSPEEIDPALGEQIRAATTAAIGAAPVADTVAFVVNPSADLAREPARPAAPVLVAPARPAPYDMQSASWTTKAEHLLTTTPLFVLVALPVAGAMILIGAALTLYRLGRARRLSDRERDRLARKFKTLLEGGVGVS